MQRSNYVNDRQDQTHSGMLPQSGALEGGDHAGERQSANGSLFLRAQIAGRAHSRGERVENANPTPSPAKAGWRGSPGNGKQFTPSLYTLMDSRGPR
ncbi:hypothetical protein [Candidatus Methylacidiphilum fumarolicum]|uniref:hypothetical protein n=1 Tax=Candidatus Methylacidiphilum fumarolicum TaxID=591154 RepID=UPI000A69EF09|nr:hypothetical protein [Candidatus Methylacidiphilum fumarolicum]